MVLTTLLGVINGFIVVRTGLPSFIVTLATLFIIRGATQALTAQITQITYIPIAPAARSRPTRSPGSSTGASATSRSRSCGGSCSR